MNVFHWTPIHPIASLGTMSTEQKKLFDVLRTMTRTERILAFETLLEWRVEAQLNSAMKFREWSDEEQVSALDAIDKIYCTDCGEEMPTNPRDEHFCDDEEDEDEDDDG